MILRSQNGTLLLLAPHALRFAKPRGRKTLLLTGQKRAPHIAHHKLTSREVAIRDRALVEGLPSHVKDAIGKQATEQLARALDGDAAAMRSVVTTLMPIVRARVLRVLWRAHRSDPWMGNFRQEVDDLVQVAFQALFENDAAKLRAWQPGRGLSLSNFVGFVTEREVLDALRVKRRNPWSERPSTFDDLQSALEASGPASPVEGTVITRDLLRNLLERLRVELSPRAQALFQLLIVDEAPIEEVSVQLAMTPDALYAWRSRLLREARRHMKELSSSEPAPQAVAEKRGRP